MVDEKVSLELLQITRRTDDFAYDVKYDVTVKIESDAYYPYNCVTGSLKVRRLKFDHGNRVNHPSIETIEEHSKKAIMECLKALVP